MLMMAMQGVSALAAAPSISQLSSLDLSDNPLGPEAGEHLALLLGRAIGLVSLNLQQTGLGDTGACCWVPVGVCQHHYYNSNDIIR